MLNESYKSILSIGFFDHNLCTRCGTCAGVCPTNAISITDDFFPDLIEDRCTKCGMCAKTCPGNSINFAALSQNVLGVTTPAKSGVARAAEES